jgi:hypothetical protein
MELTLKQAKDQYLLKSVKMFEDGKMFASGLVFRVYESSDSRILFCISDHEDIGSYRTELAFQFGKIPPRLEIQMTDPTLLRRDLVDRIFVYTEESFDEYAQYFLESY